VNQRRRFGTIAVSVAMAMTVVGCSLGSSTTTGSGGLGQTPTSPSASPIVSEEPSPTASPTPSSTPVSVTPKPPPPPPPAKPGQCQRTPQTVGKSQSAKTILAELKVAADTDEYLVAKPLVVDPHLKGNEPVVHVPLTMLKAVAAQESGWTSNCISRDGTDAYGTMQMQSATAATANQHFGTSFNRLDPKQNILVANAFLDYLTVDLGIKYFGTEFSLSSNRTVIGDDTNGNHIHVTLREAVLAAYNTGLGNVDNTMGDGRIHIGSVGFGYASSVQGLMKSSQPCQKSWGR
jgi:soluble lytic murein transglycosylase-like protein